MRNVLHIYSTYRELEYEFRNFIKLNESMVVSAQQHTVVIGGEIGGVRHTFKVLEADILGTRYTEVIFGDGVSDETKWRILPSVDRS